MRGDINLLPKKRSGEKTKVATGFIIIIIVIFAVSAFLFVYLPNMDKRSINKEIKQKETELDMITASPEEYEKLLVDLNVLKEKYIVFGLIKKNNLAGSKILEDIESAIPTSIVLQEINYSIGHTNIKGATPSDVQLSQFMVNLRKIENITEVNLLSMKSKNEQDPSAIYDFDLSVYFNAEFEGIEESEEDRESEDASEEISTEENTTEEGTE